MEHNINLTQTAIVIFAALLGGFTLSRFKQPSMLGYILVGVILGPSGFALINTREQVSSLAELGVLLLLFVVGMELNLKIFKKILLKTSLCALLQIIISTIVVFSLARFFNWPLGLTLLLGFVISLSSTAVVFKMIESMGETSSEIGQFTIGVLIAQDLAVIPMILILRNCKLEAGAGLLDSVLWGKLLFAIAFIAFLITYLSRRQRVRLTLSFMFSDEKDLIPLVSLSFCFAAAAISGFVGLSAPYGAFLAGLFLGNTHERMLFFETTKPIQSILIMVFFLSIGLLLDLRFIFNHLGAVLCLLFIVTIAKTIFNAGILRILRLPWSQAFLIGTTLSQLGEFAFLMATIARESQIINAFGESLIISLTTLSLAFSPIWLMTARRLKDITHKNTVPLRIILKIVYGYEFLLIRKFFTKIISIIVRVSPFRKEVKGDE
ncbi:MAG: cation:proton antiporter domain-containing protein [Alphaproteobacteria bacterium]